MLCCRSGILCVIPWVIFNTAYSDINSNTFPFSTLALLLAILTAFVLSTVWPLYRALYKPPIPQQDADDTVDCGNLAAQLSTKAGYDNFEKFLTTEFSVENLQFFTQVERVRAGSATAAAAAATASPAAFRSPLCCA